MPDDYRRLREQRIRRAAKAVLTDDSPDAGVILPGPTTGCRPGWAAAVIVADGRLYVSPALRGGRYASIESVLFVPDLPRKRIGGHLYVPVEWLAEAEPELLPTLAKLLARSRARLLAALATVEAAARAPDTPKLAAPVESPNSAGA